MNTIVKYGMAAMMALTVNVGAFAQLIDTEENADSSTSAETLMAKPVFHGHGFRCFIGDKYEWGAESWDFSRSTVFAVAGYQANPYLFVGAGAGYSRWDVQNCVSVPLFADLRIELHKAIRRRMSPYAELQVGYAVGDIKSFYLSPQLGCHFNVGHRPIGISVALSYGVQRADVYDFQPGVEIMKTRETVDAYGLAVGLDF